MTPIENKNISKSYTLQEFRVTLFRSCNFMKSQILIVVSPGKIDGKILSPYSGQYTINKKNTCVQQGL